MSDIRGEIKFKTARSGGKGGQHVNKVETMVEGCWNVRKSKVFSDEEKELIIGALASKLNDEDELIVRCRETRSQLENKVRVIKKMSRMIEKSMVKPKKRKKTSPSAASREKRIKEKKITSAFKETRKKITEH